MPTRRFDLQRFLVGIHQTLPFLEYCQLHKIPYNSPRSSRPAAVWRAWQSAIEGLFPDERIQVERDFALVHELSDTQTSNSLNEVLRSPPSLKIPAGAPLALWCFLHDEETFRFLLLNGELDFTSDWYHASAKPRLLIPPDSELLSRYRKALEEVYGEYHSGPLFVAVEILHLNNSLVLFGQVGDRTQTVETQDRKGKLTTKSHTPIHPATLVYTPQTGAVQFQTPFRSQQRIDRWVEACSEVLQSPILRQSVSLKLDRLRNPFPAVGRLSAITDIRVRQIHLREQLTGRGRTIKLETLAHDEPDAVWQLLERHTHKQSVHALKVIFVELQVGVMTPLGRKSVSVKLWEDRSNIPETELGNAIRATLSRWGIYHA